MKKGRKTKSAPNKFAKTEEHARWAVGRRQLLESDALERSQYD